MHVCMLVPCIRPSHLQHSEHICKAVIQVDGAAAGAIKGQGRCNLRQSQACQSRPDHARRQCKLLVCQAHTLRAMVEAWSPRAAIALQASVPQASHLAHRFAIFTSSALQ